MAHSFFVWPLGHRLQVSAVGNGGMTECFSTGKVLLGLHFRQITLPFVWRMNSREEGGRAPRELLGKPIGVALEERRLALSLKPSREVRLVIQIWKLSAYILV